METKIKTPRRIFTVIIHADKEYDVYDIEGKEHSGYNDVPKTWWLYYSKRLPEGLIPPHDSNSFVPFSRQINRRLWDIKIHQYNSSKEKWGETRFSSGTQVEMRCNGKKVYEFGTFDLSFAFAKIQYLQVVLSEHPYNFFETEKENGRKICWYGLPATVKVNKAQTWEIGIVPDYTAGLSKEEWWKELRRRKSNYSKPDDCDKQMDEIDEEEEKESERDDYINWGDALSDGNIYWFRNSEEKK